jgi:hypothetical protein
MNKGKFFLAFLLIMILLTGILLTAYGLSTASSSIQGSTGTLDGQSLLQQRCTVCHDISGISQLHGNSQQWKGLVDQMISRGARLNSQEEQTLVDYLAQTYK